MPATKQKVSNMKHSAGGGPGSVMIYEHTTEEALVNTKIDKTTGIISGVSLLGPISKRGYTYSDAALNQSVPLYEGTQVFVDHPTVTEMRDRGVRSIRDLVGTIRNARRDGDRIRGDVHLLQVEPLRSQILAIAEQMPRTAGMSHRADVVMRRKDGKYAVEQINRIQSVDLVTSPATTAGIFESQEEPVMDLAKLKAEHPDLVEQVVRESQEGADLMLITAERDKFKKKVEEMEAADKKRVEESAAAEKRKTFITAKLAEAKIPESAVSAIFRKALEEASSEKDVADLIEDRKGFVKTGITGPKSPERKVQESTNGQFTTPDLSKIGEFGTRLGVLS